jgi:hypothetical protein
MQIGCNVGPIRATPQRDDGDSVVACLFRDNLFSSEFRPVQGDDAFVLMHKALDDQPVRRCAKIIRRTGGQRIGRDGSDLPAASHVIT